MKIRNQLIILAKENNLKTRKSKNGIFFYSKILSSIPTKTTKTISNKDLKESDVVIQQSNELVKIEVLSYKPLYSTYISYMDMVIDFKDDLFDELRILIEQSKEKED